MTQSQIFSALFAVVLFVAGARGSSAEGVVTIEDFEGYSSGVGSWSAASNGINASVGLISTGAIEGSKSLATTLQFSTFGGDYSVYNSNLDVQVPPGIETFKFKYRVLAGLNLNKKFRILITDQNNTIYTSPLTSLGTLSINSTKDYGLALNAFSPSAAGGVIKRIKGVRLNFESSVASLAADEQLDSFRVTWDDSGVSYGPHVMGIDFGTRVNGPNSTFTMNLSLSPADVNIAKYSIRVGYDSTQVTFDGVTNNTGQPASTVTYNVGAASPLTGYANVNTYQTVTMDALPALITPTILGQLNFTATAEFNDPNNRVYIVLLANPPIPSLRDTNWNPVPVTFNDPNTPVPVGLSVFTLE